MIPTASPPPRLSDAPSPLQRATGLKERAVAALGCNVDENEEPTPTGLALLKASVDTSDTHRENETADSELVVAVFRIVVLLVALTIPRIFGTSHTVPLSELLLAGLAGVYALVAALACLYPRRYGVRRPFLVAFDILLITLWMRLTQQWELFSLYYIVVIVAAMWFRVLGGAVSAILCNFFFLFLWGRVAGDTALQSPPVFTSSYALGVALLLLVGCLAGYIAEAQERERLRRLEGQLLVANYQREIDLANQLQPLLLEEGDARLAAAKPHMRLGAAMKSARTFGGGDYFDVLSLPDGRVALCIADVSGKSMRAQARLPLLKYSLRALAPLYAEPGALLTRLNQTLAPDLGNDLFIGMCLVVIDPTRGVLVWCNAGHIAPLLLSGEGDDVTATPLETSGPALGPFPEIPYCARSVEWQRGDRLLLFTDGLSDGLSFDGTEDGEEQVRAAALALDDTMWLEPSQVAQRLLDMALAVLDEINVPVWRARLSAERIASEKLGKERVSEETAHVRRDDITVVAVTLGVETTEADAEKIAKNGKTPEA
ncbi:MAG TPA: PP2C family protein-serine/threonine phosphatase [Abditibacteriaceae bacterium]|jgi:hypothetical protein